MEIAYPITVYYHVGTTQREGRATTITGAQRIANRNRNAWDPKFYDADGRGLVPVLDNGRLVDFATVDTWDL